MTRLVPPLSQNEAADLHAALLRDTVAACRLEAEAVFVLYGSAADLAPLRAVLGGDVPLELQGGTGLADALRLGLQRHCQEGPVAVLSSDIPGVPPGALDRAFGLLEQGIDVVLGPARDGGYWLIAMSEPHEAPFRDIPWSTPAVRAVTLARCRPAGLAAAEVELWRDVDTPADLAALTGDAGAAPARHARAFLERVGPLSEAAPSTLVESELLDASPWRTVLADRLTNGSGSTRYTYLATPRAVFVVPLTDGGEVVLVRQYRHPVRDWTLEVPAGSLREGETPLEAARRELREETGGRAESWEHLTTFYSSSAHLSLRSDIYLATRLALACSSRGEDENLTVVRLDWKDAVERARSGGFLEGQTALAILLAAATLDRQANERS